VLPATAPSGFWLFGMQCSVLEVRPPAHRCASVHFFSEISRLQLARDRGRGPWVPGCPAAILAHSSAFSDKLLGGCLRKSVFSCFTILKASS